MSRNLEVAVVGAGIIGACLADALVRAGASVTVIDRARPGSGTSGSSLAWLNANRKLPRHYHDLSARSLADWRQLAAAFGEPDWYVPSGSLTWAEVFAETGAGTEAEPAAGPGAGELTERLERLTAWGYAAEQLTAHQAAELEPSLRIPAGAHVAFFPGESFVHGHLAVEALLARAAPRLIVADGDVTFEGDGAGITAVRLPGGERVQADVYVCCAGWRTARLLEPLGVSIPLTGAGEAGSAAPCLVTRTSGAGQVNRVVNAPGLTLRPLPRRGLQLEASDINERVDLGTGRNDLDRHGTELLRRAGAAVHGFEAGEAQHRLCVRPLPVDGHPIVGWVPALPNAYVSVTHSGMTLAPALARLAAAEILGGEAGDDLRPYRPTRFAQV
ncbi:FAD-binding oxidoreductase [Actinoplanes sp. M2I2]|uniref:NAD(P)/FAD-dependent oxidoreductase n=1 Tax=Actinoplanes sp. M2I2 TaxID=1734444 RepID=UPI0020200FFB|nr:FAD-binding oxidoreductase [Actinoplanes sp. M2I2]